METDVRTRHPDMGDASPDRSRLRLEDAALRTRILSGEELASVEQLLRGHPFAFGDMAKDSTEFVSVLAEWAEALSNPGLAALLRPALRELGDTCNLRTVGALSDALAAANRLEPHPELLGGFLRCRIYMAHLGFEDAAILVAADAIRIAAVQDWDHEADGLDVVWQSLGWLLHYACLRSRREDERVPDRVAVATEAVVHEGARMFESRVRRLAVEAVGLPHVAPGTSPAGGSRT